jgi:hypothetical protein
MVGSLLAAGEDKPEMNNLMNEIQQRIHYFYVAKIAVYQKFVNV